MVVLVLLAAAVVACVVAAALVSRYRRRRTNPVGKARAGEGPALDAALPVRAATALCLVDERAAVSLEEAARALGLDPLPATGEGASLQAHVASAEALLCGLRRRREEWTAIDERLSEGEGFAEILRLAGIPAAVLAAGVRAFDYVHQDAFREPADERVIDFAEYVELHASDTGQRPHAPVAGEGRRADDAFADLRGRLRQLSGAVDPHTRERDALAREMAELGLVGDGTGVPGRREYERLLGEYESDMLVLARDLSAALRSCIATHEGAFMEALEAPARLEEPAQARLRGLLSTLRRATSRDGAPSSPTASDVAKEGRLLVAMASAAAAAPPAAAASHEYRTACAAVATDLRDLGDLHRAELSRWSTRTLERLRECDARIAEAAQAAITTCLSERELLWTRLQRAAEGVKAETARQVLDADPDVDVALPVRAAAAFCLVEDRVAADLERSAGALLLEPPATTDPTSIAGRVVCAGELLSGLERRADTWRLVHEAMSDGGDPSGQVLRRAGIPAALVPAGLRAHEYLREARFSETADRLVVDFAECVESLAGDESDGSPTELEAPEPRAGAEGAFAGVTARLGELTDPADPHAQDRASLSRQMIELGLTAKGTTVSAKPRYERLLGSYDGRALQIAQDLLVTVLSGIAAQRAPFSGALQAPPRLDGPAAAKLQQALTAVRDATARYAEQLDSLLSSAPDEAARANARQRAAVATRALAASRRHADDGHLLAALSGVAAGALPVAEAWDASRAYAAACAEAATTLRDLADVHRAELADWSGRTLEQLQSCHVQITDVVESAIGGYVGEREHLWTELEAAADRVKAETAREILDADPDLDVALPVRGAAAFCMVDELAADNLERTASALVLDPPPTTESASIEDHLRPIEKLFESLERNSVAWAATNAVLLQALAPESVGGDALAHSMLGLAAVPEHIMQAGSDVVSYLHGAAPHDAALSINEFASYAVHHLVPATAVDASLPETLLQQVHHSVSGLMDFKGTLVGQLLAHDLGFGPAIAGYLKGDAIHSAEFFLRQAEQAPQLHDAVGHLAQAGDLTGSAVLHGLAGHVPVVTLVLSTCHEIRVRRDHDTSIGDSAANIAIDVIGVGTGLGAAAAAGSLLGVHGGPLIALTVPGAMIGRAVSNVVKKKRLEKAVAELTRVRGVYNRQFSTVVSDFSSSVRETVAAQNAKYRRTIGEPPCLEATAHREIDGLVRGLRAATARYAELTGTLLRTAEGTFPQQEVKSAQLGLEAAREALRRCDAELERGDPTAALMSLADAALPFAPSWQVSNEYRGACIASAEAVRDLSGQNREQVARWATRASERFERSKTAITTTVGSAARTCIDEIKVAAAPVDAAFEVVNLERARLGLPSG